MHEPRKIAKQVCVQILSFDDYLDVGMIII